MAEIKIEKKSSPWPWIVAGIIILAILFYFLFMQPNAEIKVVENQDSLSTMKMDTYESDNSSVYAFTSFVDSNTNQMDLDHDYSRTGLVKLCDATEEVANETGHEVNADLDEAREYANKITDDPAVTTHADNIKKSSRIISNVLKNIQEDSFPGLGAEAENLKSASQAISTEDLTLDQKGVVKSFFSSAAMLLKQMK